MKKDLRSNANGHISRSEIDLLEYDNAVIVTLIFFNIILF